MLASDEVISASGHAQYLAAAAQAMGIWEGQLLAGKYRVERVLGAGGMGVVVSARHLQLDERVAIKLLRAQTLAHPKALARFAREARAAAKIKSEHAAFVADVGTLENGTPYMVMEHLDGLDLAAWLRDRGALGWSQAIEFVLQACEALAVAHANGIVHRDLKPANLFITRRVDGTDCLKVLDFGISRVESDISMTQTAQVLGSPLYMSPEQLSAPESVDARSDIWSLGVILFELLSGAPPFTAPTLPELVTRIMTEPPPALPVPRGEASLALDQVIRRCLEKDRGLRFASVAELGSALLPFASASGRVSVQRIAGILRSPAVADTLRAHDETALGLEQPTFDVPRPRRAGWWALLFALLAITAVGFVFVKRAQRAELDQRATQPSASASALGAAPRVPSTVPSLPAPIEVLPAPLPTASSAPVARPSRALPKAVKPSALLNAEPTASGPSEPPAPPPPPPTPIDPFEDRK